ncbi:MAG: thiamine-phosphate pyrophosphorylase [Candidatus Omnitrophica bacterium]|nr:thiamine-phosphate pyrophosphorylase [Candidatus Omnitrophota bacterium]
MWRKAYLRIMDSNYNRAKEALRVCEDILRFAFNDSRGTLRAKQLRHRLTRILLGLPVPYAKIVAARDTARDVGRERSLNDKKRPGAPDIFEANVKRAQEAVRVLEEVTRAVYPARASEFENLRFSLYELEKRFAEKF